MNDDDEHGQYNDLSECRRCGHDEGLNEWTGYCEKCDEEMFK